MRPTSSEFDMFALTYKEKIESLHLEGFLKLSTDHPVSSILKFVITGHVLIACCSTLPPSCHLFTLTLWTPAQAPLSPTIRRIWRAFLIIHWVRGQPFSYAHLNPLPKKTAALWWLWVGSSNGKDDKNHLFIPHQVSWQMYCLLCQRYPNPLPTPLEAERVLLVLPIPGW